MKLTNLFESKLDVNKRYVQKMYKQGLANPIGRGVIYSFTDDEVNAMILVELTPMEGRVILSELRVLEGKYKMGFGAAVLDMLTKEADKMKVDLSLHAVPLKGEGKTIPKNKLKTFYKKHGFVLQGKGGDQMMREPK